jgi:protein tyrosine phosphatase (PTP) superfamily phosphohydrolase (DUF442 family)
VSGTRRWRRAAARALAAYVGLTVLAYVAAFALVLFSRLSAGDPRSDEIEGIRNLRRADDRVWLGAQPDEAAYRELARRGVTSVVDLRTGANDDDREDDPELLKELGMDYTSLPIPDGHTPSQGDVKALLDVVRVSDGVVFVHCGGGAGRSSAMQAAYLAATGTEPPFLKLTAIGPVTLQQAWVVATARAGDPGMSNPVVRRLSEALDAPRRLLSRVRALP